MKTNNVIIVLIVGIVAGYLIRMAVHTHPHEIHSNEDPAVGTELYKKITKDQAKILVSNNEDTSKYIFLNDDLLSEINAIKKNDNAGAASLIYFASSVKGGEFDGIVVTRMKSTSEPVTNSNYYSVAATYSTVEICPPTCDVISPLPLKTIYCEKCPSKDDPEEQDNVE